MTSTEILVFSILLISGLALLWKLYLQRSKDKSKLHTTPINNVYVIRTHLWNDYVEKVFLKMQSQLGAENVFLMYDETNKPIHQPHIRWNDSNGVTKGPAIITVNEADCAVINELHTVGERTGSTYRPEAQIYACYKAIRRDYDYLWFIEFDVYCNDYKKALGPFDAIKADMLTKGTANNKQRKARTSKLNADWFWWNYLIGDIKNTPLEQQRGCFFPINRFSKKFLSVMEANLSKSTGYCEVYFPTLCHTNGLVLETMPLSTFASFLYRPTITADELQKIKQSDCRLYHPVKEMQPTVIVESLKQAVLAGKK